MPAWQHTETDATSLDDDDVEDDDSACGDDELGNDDIWMGVMHIDARGQERFPNCGKDLHPVQVMNWSGN